MTSIPGHKPSTAEWLTFQAMSPQRCMSMNDSVVYICIQPNDYWCISTYNQTTTTPTTTSTLVPNTYDTLPNSTIRLYNIFNDHQQHNICIYIYSYMQIKSTHKSLHHFIVFTFIIKLIDSLKHFRMLKTKS